MSSKRARFDASAQLPTTDTPSEKKATTPMAIAMSHIEDHLSSLRTEFASILTKYAADVLKAKVTAYLKKRTLGRMETDETVVPRSARVKFDLTSKYKQVEISEEFITLKDATAKLVTAFQSNLKSKIVDTAKLDIKFCEQAHQKELAKALRLATKAFLIAESQDSSDTDVDKMVNTILDRHHEELLKNTRPTATLDAFRTIYKEVNMVGMLPAPIAPTLAPAAANAAAQQVDTDQGSSLALQGMLGDDVRGARLQPAQPAPAHQPLQPTRPSKSEIAITKLFRTFDSIFVVPFKIYRDTTERSDIDLKLKKFSTETTLVQSTANAAMEVDEEPPATPALLRELISKLVLVKTPTLQKKIDQLEKKNRGARPGAPPTKKKNRPRPPRTLPRRPLAKTKTSHRKPTTKERTAARKGARTRKTNKAKTVKPTMPTTLPKTARKQVEKTNRTNQRKGSKGAPTKRTRARQVNPEADGTSLRVLLQPLIHYTTQCIFIFFFHAYMVLF